MYVWKSHSVVVMQWEDQVWRTGAESLRGDAESVKEGATKEEEEEDDVKEAGITELCGLMREDQG